MFGKRVSGRKIRGSESAKKRDRERLRGWEGGRASKTLVAQWIHFTLFGIRLPTTNIKRKVYILGGLMNSATKKQSLIWVGSSRVETRRSKIRILDWSAGASLFFEEVNPTLTSPPSKGVPEAMSLSSRPLKPVASPHVTTSIGALKITYTIFFGGGGHITTFV